MVCIGHAEYHLLLIKLKVGSSNSNFSLRLSCANINCKGISYNAGCHEIIWHGGMIAKILFSTHLVKYAWHM